MKKSTLSSSLKKMPLMAATAATTIIVVSTSSSNMLADVSAFVTPSSTSTTRLMTKTKREVSSSWSKTTAATTTTTTCLYEKKEKDNKQPPSGKRDNDNDDDSFFFKTNKFMDPIEFSGTIYGSEEYGGPMKSGSNNNNNASRVEESLFQQYEDFGVLEAKANAHLLGGKSTSAARAGTGNTGSVAQESPFFIISDEDPSKVLRDLAKADNDLHFMISDEYLNLKDVSSSSSSKSSKKPIKPPPPPSSSSIMEDPQLLNPEDNHGSLLPPPPSSSSSKSNKPTASSKSKSQQQTPKWKPRSMKDLPTININVDYINGATESSGPWSIGNIYGSSSSKKSDYTNDSSKSSSSTHSSENYHLNIESTNKKVPQQEPSSSSNAVSQPQQQSTGSSISQQRRRTQVQYLEYLTSLYVIWSALIADNGAMEGHVLRFMTVIPLTMLLLVGYSGGNNDIDNVDSSNVVVEVSSQQHTQSYKQYYKNKTIMYEEDEGDNLPKQHQEEEDTIVRGNVNSSRNKKTLTISYSIMASLLFGALPQPISASFVTLGFFMAGTYYLTYNVLLMNLLGD